MHEMTGNEPELMTAGLIEEFARTGMDEEEIFQLFRSPYYRIHQYYLLRGEKEVRGLIRDVLARTGQVPVISRPPAW